MTFYPYAERYDVVRGLPSEGRPTRRNLKELREMADLEDAKWETGKASGSFYCGDHEHYDFMGEAYAMYSHMNALQRDVCPSATRFEGEIIAMGLDLMHASAVDRQRAGRDAHQRRQRQHPARHAGVPRAGARRAASRTPTSSSRRPRHPAFDKACHLLGHRDAARRRSTPHTAQVDVDAMAAMIDDNTAAIVGSACNYGYGTIDPIAELSDSGARARRRPARRRLPRRVHPPVRRATRLRHPALRLPPTRA